MSDAGEKPSKHYRQVERLPLLHMKGSGLHCMMSSWLAQAQSRSFVGGGPNDACWHVVRDGLQLAGQPEILAQAYSPLNLLGQQKGHCRRQGSVPEGQKILTYMMPTRSAWQLVLVSNLTMHASVSAYEPPGSAECGAAEAGNRNS